MCFLISVWYDFHIGNCLFLIFSCDSLSNAYPIAPIKTFAFLSNVSESPSDVCLIALQYPEMRIGKSKFIIFILNKL